jgi:hypothetical protein
MTCFQLPIRTDCLCLHFAVARMCKCFHMLSVGSRRLYAGQLKCLSPVFAVCYGRVSKRHVLYSDGGW